MASSWWWMWMVVMVVLLVPPMGYGWGYRGWGPPYPIYVQRRRSERAGLTGGGGSFDHYSWSWGGDVLWMIFLFGAVWFATAFWWPYTWR
jgi:hypothetical protein